MCLEYFSRFFIITFLEVKVDIDQVNPAQVVKPKGGDFSNFQRFFFKTSNYYVQREYTKVMAGAVLQVRPPTI